MPSPNPAGCGGVQTECCGKKTPDSVSLKLSGTDACTGSLTIPLHVTWDIAAPKWVSPAGVTYHFKCQQFPGGDCNSPISIADVVLRCTGSGSSAQYQLVFGGFTFTARCASGSSFSVNFGAQVISGCFFAVNLSLS